MREIRTRPLFDLPAFEDRRTLFIEGCHAFKAIVCVDQTVAGLHLKTIGCSQFHLGVQCIAHFRPIHANLKHVGADLFAIKRGVNRHFRVRHSDRSVRLGHTQNMLTHVRQNQVGRNRGDLVQAGFTEFTLNVVFSGKAKATMRLQTHIGRLPGRVCCQ